jgi:hypothetical protein
VISQLELKLFTVIRQVSCVKFKTKQLLGQQQRALFGSGFRWQRFEYVFARVLEIISLLVYRNMKPYYRFTVPQLYLYPPEIELWERTYNDAEYPVKQLYEGLKTCMNQASYFMLILSYVKYKSW